MKTLQIIGIVGSLRKQSFNRSLMDAVKSAAPAGVALEIADISTVPFYNQDLELTDFPPTVQALKDKIAAADGIIIATPEYLRSMPGVLKNAIDWTSRPHGTSPWKGKVTATMGATEGMLGTALAQAHVRQVLAYLGTRLMGQPEFYLGGVAKKLDAGGVLTDSDTKERIAKFWEAFITEVKRTL